MMGLGMGLAISPYNTGVMQVVDNASITTATSFFTMFNLIAHTLAIIFASNFVTEYGKTKLIAFAHTILPNASEHQIAFMNYAIEQTNRSIEIYNELDPETAQSMFNIVESSFLHSMHTLFFACAILCLLSVFFSWKFLPKK